MKKNKLAGVMSLAILFFLATCLFSCSKDNDEPAPTEPPLVVGNEDCKIETFQIKSIKNGFSNANIVFKINQGEKTITGTCVDWIDLEEPDKLIASFTYKGEGVTIGGVKQVSEETQNSFKDELIYTVTAENGDKTDYKVILISPQINQEMPILHFKPEGPIQDKEIYVKSKLTIIGYDITEGLWDESKEDVEIRLRGNSTSGLPKKPYRVKFPEKISPLGLNHSKAKSWVLLANDTDKTLLRNSIALAMSRILFNAASATNYHDTNAILFTPAAMHVHVYMSGKYIGLYTFTDQVEKEDGRVSVESLAQKNGSAADKITGGYLLEVDIHANENSEPFYFASSQGMRITPKYPKDDDHDPAQYEYIKNHLKIAEDALYGTNLTDPVNGWRKYFDEATAVDYFIINELCGNPDGYSSTYLYKRRDIDKFFFGPVWDFDKAFNNDNRTSNPLNSLMVHVGFYSMNFNDGNHWFRTLWNKDPGFRAAVKTRWNSKNELLLAAANEILEQEPQRIPHSIAANFTKWDVTEQALRDAMPAPRDYKDGVSILKSYMSVRHNYLNTLFNTQ